MTRSTPLRVLMSSWVATSSGVPNLKLPPMSMYTPSVFSRMTVKLMSSGVAFFSGQSEESSNRTGRTLA